MPNSFSIPTDLTATNDLITTVDTVADLLAVNLAVVDVVVDAIRATDITTITDAVAAKIVRGTFTVTAYNAVLGDLNWHEMIGVTGHGKLIYIMSNHYTTDGDIRLTVDGVLSNELAVTTIQNVSLNQQRHNQQWQLAICEDEIPARLDLEFHTSFSFEGKQDNAANTVRCMAVYQLD